MNHFQIKIQIPEDAILAAISKALAFGEQCHRRDLFVSVCREYIYQFGVHCVEDHLEEYWAHTKEASELLKVYLPLITKNNKKIAHKSAGALIGGKTL